MTEKTWRRVTGGVAVLVGVLALFLLVGQIDWLVNPLLGVLPPFVIAFLLAYLLDPLLVRLQRRGLSRGRALLVVSLTFLLAFVITLLFLVPRIAEQGVNLAKDLPTYAKEAGQALNKLLAKERSLLERLNLPTTVAGFASRFSAEIRSVSAAVLTSISSFVIGLFSKALWLFLIPLLTVYLLGAWADIRRRVSYLIPEAHRPRVLELSGNIGRVFNAYIRGQIILSLLYAATTAFILAVFFRMQYSLILGLVAGLVSPIPYIGSAIILISTGVVAYAQNPSTGYVLGVLAAMLIQNNIIFDNVVAPRVLGGAVGLNLFWSVFALILGGSMFGFIGVILAYPVGAIIQVIICNLFPRLCENPPDVSTGALSEQPPG